MGYGRERILGFLGAVNSLGHPARVVEAIKKQAENFLHCSNLYYISPRRNWPVVDRPFGGRPGFSATAG